MPQYYYNNNPDDKNYHEVHVSTCPWLPTLLNRKDLGFHLNCEQAIRYATHTVGGRTFDGCAHCSDACHTG